jgi:glycosyltransferase involved in cell wall biosynthesis
VRTSISEGADAGTDERPHAGGRTVGAAADGVEFGSVLIATPWYPPTVGGVAEVAERLRGGLRARGVETYVQVTNTESAASGMESEGIWYAPIPSYFFRRPGISMAARTLVRGGGALARLARRVRRHGIRTIVVLYPVENAWAYLLLSRLLGIRIVVSLHGSDVAGPEPLSRPRAWLLRRTLRDAHSVVVCADHLALTARRIAAPAGIRTRLIPNFVDSRHFTPPDDREKRTAAPLFLHVSNFAEKKRAGDIVEAFARARLPAGSRLRMVGDGFTRQRVMRRAEELGVSGTVEFTGAARDVRPHYREADVFVLSSSAEGAPLVLLEAMACGLPWISTEWGAAAELPVGECGLTFESGDVNALALAMEELASHRDRCTAMGLRARARAVDDYGPARYVQSHLELLARR